MALHHATESECERFAVQVLTRVGVSTEVARAATRSILDASLMGIDTHGIASLEMYVTHIQRGGMDPNVEAVRLGPAGAVELWDMRHGFGLSCGKQLMAHAVEQAQEHGICFLTCRNTNHIGACGVYGKIAADADMVAMVSQQTLASLSPWGGTEARVGQSPRR